MFFSQKLFYSAEPHLNSEASGYMLQGCRFRPSLLAHLRTQWKSWLARDDWTSGRDRSQLISEVCIAQIYTPSIYRCWLSVIPGGCSLLQYLWKLLFCEDNFWDCCCWPQSFNFLVFECFWGSTTWNSVQNITTPESWTTLILIALPLTILQCCTENLCSKCTTLIWSSAGSLRGSVVVRVYDWTESYSVDLELAHRLALLIYIISQVTTTKLRSTAAAAAFSDSRNTCP